MGACCSAGSCPCGGAAPVHPDRHCKQMSGNSELFYIGQKDFRWYYSLDSPAEVTVYLAKCRDNTGWVTKSWTIALDGGCAEPPSAAAAYLGISGERSVVGLDVSGGRPGTWVLDGDSFFWTERGVLPAWVNQDAVAIRRGEVVVSRYQEGHHLAVRYLPSFCALWNRLRLPPAVNAQYAYLPGSRWYLSKNGCLWSLGADGALTLYRSLGDASPQRVVSPAPPEGQGGLAIQTVHQGGDGVVYLEVGGHPVVRYVNRHEIIYEDLDDLEDPKGDELKSVPNNGVVYLTRGADEAPGCVVVRVRPIEAIWGTGGAGSPKQEFGPEPWRNTGPIAINDKSATERTPLCVNSV